ncbi:MAG: hypothetical protein ACYCQJ_12195 [Nitrososphaerales archaeon]
MLVPDLILETTIHLEKQHLPKTLASLESFQARWVKLRLDQLTEELGEQGRHGNHSKKWKLRTNKIFDKIIED